MQQLSRILGTLVVLSVLFFATEAAPSDAGSQPARTQELPNIVFILADDMREDDLRFMPETRNILEAKGTRYTNAFVPFSICCPSRASILRGQYAHNHKVIENAAPDGGYKKFRAMGHEASNLATTLHDAGYRTGLFGKYLNDYDRAKQAPRGWDKWFSKLDPGQLAYYDYEVNDDGKRKRYGSAPKDYYTDVLSKKVEKFIKRKASSPAPFFAYVAPSAPHGPAIAAPRHAQSLENLKAPRPPSFNEEDVSDKPPRLADEPQLKAEQVRKIDQLYRNRARTLQALDDLVKAIYEQVEASGELSNTYFVFTSDNGYHLGEHRLFDKKRTPYEETIGVPLILRGPGVPEGEVSSHLALNLDFLPTFAEWAGAPIPDYVDGRSLVPTYDEANPEWRERFLLENITSQRSTRAYQGVREESRKYVLYEGRSEEFYELDSDPYELSSDPRAVPEEMKQATAELSVCARAGCRMAEE